jgi:predicted TIM-barrel fold metal-dependent hydrolase
MTKGPNEATGRCVDCHAHVFTLELPMAADSRYRPAVAASLADYCAVLDANGMARAVLVQPSFLGTDNRYLLDAIAQHPERFRGVAVVSADAEAEHLADLRTAGVRGIRFNLIGRDLPAFDREPWAGLVRRIAEAGLHIEVQSEGDAWVALLPPLLRAGAVVVIDHFGRPASHEPGQCPGFAAVLAAARDPSVWIKLSAPYRFSADARAAAAALRDAAGTDRMIWGSDWPWTQHPEITSYAAIRDRLETWLDPATRDAVLCDNPRRLYWR